MSARMTADTRLDFPRTARTARRLEVSLDRHAVAAIQRGQGGRRPRRLRVRTTAATARANRHPALSPTGVPKTAW